jgi:type II secretory pathway pseudopilin PulG
MTARDRFVIAVVAVLAALVAGWLLIIQPKRSEASRLGGQVSTAQQQLDTAQSEVATAQANRTAFAANYASVARLGEAVPADDNIPSLILQLQGAANGARVDFRALQLSGGSGAAAPTGNAAATQAVTSTLPPGAAVGPGGFPTMPFTFVFTGNFFHLSDFFGRLQQFVVATNKQVSVSGRLMTLNAISLGPSTGGFPNIVANISATSYLVPPTQGVLAGATPSGPSTQPASTSGSSVPATTATITP